MAQPVDPAAGFDHTLLIAATPGRVMAAFFDPDALRTWWQTARSVTTPRALGIYAVEWEPTPDADEILGRLGGVFYGTVMDYVAGRELLVSDAWWLAPDGDPIGPMSLAVTCQLEGAGCRLRVRQSGFEESVRWRRYYDVIAHGWMTSLAALKQHLEGRSGG